MEVGMLHGEWRMLMFAARRERPASARALVMPMCDETASVSAACTAHGAARGGVP